MGKTYQPEEIQEVGVQLVPGNYLFSIGELDDSEVSSNGNYQIVGTLMVVEPTAFAGSPFKEYFVIGTPDDPSAEEGDTWKKSYAAGRYRQLLNKAGIELSGDVEADIAAATGQQVGGQVIQESQPATLRDGSPNPRAGRMQSRVAMYWRPGERTTGIGDPNGAVAGSARPGPVALPTQKAPTATPPKPVGRPPAIKPAVAGAPKAPTPIKPTAVPKVQMLDCPVCQAKVPRTEFGAHVAAHDQAAGEEE